MRSGKPLAADLAFVRARSGDVMHGYARSQTALQDAKSIAGGAKGANRPRVWVLVAQDSRPGRQRGRWAADDGRLGWPTLSARPSGWRARGLNRVDAAS